MSTPPSSLDVSYELDHRYTRASGRVFLTGVQALVRLPMLQRERDRAAGLDTAGFISGYRGSPLGTYDMALWEARAHLERNDVLFQPGVNEDLAATAVWGTQQAMVQPGPTKDGVFAIWYGKGPGVDRSLDPIKHGNYMGTAKHGGVLALCGDDPGAKSSSIAHQSEQAMIHAGIPVLNPASVQEYLDFGLYGWAMSRYAGCWVAMKCLTDTVDSGASVEVGPERVRIATPEFAFPARDHHITLNNLPLEIERAVYQVKLPAAQAFARANGIDRVALDAPARRFGIVTAGKAYLDVRQALEELGLGAAECAALGLCIYKVGMTWPLEPSGVREFCRGLEGVLVVEEKRPIIEEQLARVLYNEAQRPLLSGKRDEHGAALVPNEGELAPGVIADVLRGWLARRAPEHAALLRAAAASVPIAPPSALLRLPSFCSGCPHNTSTVVPEGSIALGGIGCHGMAVWLPERRTFGATQMGGEGANWIGTAPFTSLPHVFQNLGDGTYFHSGLLAIRACVAANVNITYKVLVNGAVAMTGGQPIEGEPLEGAVTCPEIARQLVAEGVKTVVVVSDDVTRFAEGVFPSGVALRDRSELMSVQKQLRETPGVTAIVYDQTCAAEARRLRRQGKFPDPDRRIVINELVCEGCGDCSVQSNCISIEPLETEFGRKRKINQSSCNKDFSCVKGYCPSFVSVTGGKLRKLETKQAGVDEAALFAALPEPALPALEAPYNVLLAGIGGTGVVTVGAILAMAAHLEGRGASELDVTGLAQKNGAVASHVRIARTPEAIHATRIGAGGADLAIGCDAVVLTSFENLPKLSPRTTALVNTHVQPTAAFATNANLDLSADKMLAAVRAACGDANTHALGANELALALLGDAIASNMLLLGVAWQRGKLPVSRAALDRAIVLNGRGIELNRRAFAWGRLLAHDPRAVERAARPLLRAPTASADAPLEELVARRTEFLTAYQGSAYAERYRKLVVRVAEREHRAVNGHDALAKAAARYYFKLLAYKDEYEVARLYTDGSFAAQVAREFEGELSLSLHLSPQFLPAFLAPRDPETGRVKKWRIPMRVMLPAFRVMAALRFLRGSALDPFGWTRHRRDERAEIARYESTLDELLDALTPENLPIAVEIASLPEQVRGFDSVKERHLEAARHKETELLAAFRRA
jgi:indolepyruvate ferredoxin oxidoreductase